MASNNLKRLEDYPDISFIDNITVAELENEMMTDYQEEYERITGKRKILGSADRDRLILMAAVVQIYQGMQYIDRAGKMSFLKYSYDDYLENLGALFEIKRSQAKAAKTTLRFTLTEPRQTVVGIPEGTRAAAGSVYFKTVSYGEILAGEEFTELIAECLEAGTTGNDFQPGDISTLVDSIRYVSGVQNITISEGGTEEEDDDSLAERIHLAPSSYSTAGPDGAYEYWVKTLNPDVMDVVVYSPTPQAVDIRFLLKNGVLPGETAIKEMETFLRDNNIRPMTDNVVVAAPDVEEYELNVEYYINESDRTMASAIQAAVEQAIEAYVDWQKERIGRDINPSELIHRIVRAGAKRADILSPTFKTIPESSVAVMVSKNVIYGGLEDD